MISITYNSIRFNIGRFPERYLITVYIMYIRFKYNIIHFTITGEYLITLMYITHSLPSIRCRYKSIKSQSFTGFSGYFYVYIRYNPYILPRWILFIKTIYRCRYPFLPRFQYEMFASCLTFSMLQHRSKLYNSICFIRHKDYIRPA